MRHTLLSFLLLAPLAFGQVTPGSPGQISDSPFDKIKAYLNLDPRQIDSLKQIQESKAKAEAAVLAQIENKQGALAVELQSSTPNPAIVGQLTIDIRNLTKQLPIAGAPYRTSAINLLTADQRTKLNTLAIAAKLIPTITEAAELNLIEDASLNCVMGGGVPPPGSIGILPGGPVTSQIGR